MAKYQGYQLIVYEWIFFAFTVPWVVIRLYVQFSFRHRPWREIFTILALALFFTCAIVDSLQNHWHHNEDWYSSSTSPDGTKNLKAEVVIMLCYKTSVYMCKFVLLCFYMDLTPARIFKKTWFVIMVTWALNIAGVLYGIFFEFFTCQPFKNIWDPETVDCWWDREWFFTSSWVIFLFTDFLVYGIPFVILRNLKSISKADKIAAYWMFAGGLLNILCCTLMFILMMIPSEVYDAPGDAGDYLDALFYFLGPTQQGTAIIIICLPQARRFWLGMSVEVMQQGRWKRRKSGSQTRKKSVSVVGGTDDTGASGSSGRYTNDSSMTSAVKGSSVMQVESVGDEVLEVPPRVYALGPLVEEQAQGLDQCCPTCKRPY